jgi:hypothetical protein
VNGFTNNSVDSSVSNSSNQSCLAQRFLSTIRGKIREMGDKGIHETRIERREGEEPLIRRITCRVRENGLKRQDRGFPPREKAAIQVRSGWSQAGRSVKVYFLDSVFRCSAIDLAKNVNFAP